MNFTLDQLEAFVVSAESGSFSAAARKLLKSQSAISICISNLEIELNLELFDRKTRKPTLTPEGETLYKDAKLILRNTGSLQAKVNALTTGNQKNITLVVDFAAIEMEKLANQLNAFSEKFPTIEIVLLHANLEEVSDYVIQEIADIGIMLNMNPDPEYSNYRWIGEVEVATVTGGSHPLTALNKVTTADLSKYRRFRITNKTRKARKDKLDYSDTTWYIDNYDVMTQLLRKGLGWAEVPVHLFKEPLEQGTIKRLKVDYDRKPFHWPIELLWSEKTKNTKAVEYLTEKLAEVTPN